jgi:uncharacterized repeat protein (TIGR02543 family)
LLNKEVKVILDLVRMKVNAARSKIVSIVIATLISGLLVSIPVPANAAECDSISTTVGSDTVLTFADVGTCEWTVPAGVTAVRVLVVGGGGSGSAGISNVYWPAGGGGGEVVANSSISVTAGNKVTIAVGAGGAATATTSGAVGNSGGSSAFGSTTASGGLTNSNVATNNVGRIGGTSGNGNIGGTGTSSGSNCTTGSCGSGGGGGAGGAGGVTDARNGGAGVNSDISGSTVGYGGGGAGGNGSSGNASHGGAIGYYVSTSASATGNGVANTGGGGSRANGGHGGAGGSGVVIVRFLTQCNPDSVVVGTQTVVSFTDIGTCNWTVPTGVTSVRALVVAGGGAGGGGVSGSYFGAGGGGGEVLELSSVSVSTPVSVTVGAGGIKSAYSTTYTGANLALRNGSNSSFGTNTARGGKTPTDSTPVGGPTNLTPAGGVSGNGNSGTSLAGGTWGNGGSGAAGGAVGQRPGAGVISNISGTSLEYGGGGDGNNNVASDSPRDGAGTRDVEALPNRGGGGSIMPSDNYGGGAGGSGVVIVSYASASVPEPVEVAANCVAGVGIGGVAGTTANQAGHGCVLIKYSLSNKTYYQSFNYTGSNQSWTSPSDVTSLTFYLLGAGGGADNVAGRGPGGSGGFATGTYAVATPTAFTIIVGQGGNGNTPGVDTYGGGGKADYASGGGRSAIRLASATEDLITAGGGGGGGYDAKCGGAGGGTTGQDAVIRTSNGEHGKGGTQTAGGAGGYSVNARTGGTGIKYQGGLGRDESGGGGGGYWGGGGGGDNIGAGGGSGYLNPTLITSGRLVQGTCTTPGNSSSLRFTVSYNGNNNTSGTAPTETAVNAFTSTTLATNSGTLVRDGFTFAGWNTRADGAGTSYSVGQTNFTPPGDLTLYARWNSTITYSANGATGTVPTAVSTTTDASRTFLLNNGAGLSKIGLNFASWNSAADGSGLNYLGGASYTSTGSTTLYAIFRPLYTYNANGATGGTVPASTVGPVPGSQCVTDTGFNNCRVFTYTGSDQQFTLPSDIDASKGVLIEAWGAGGGGSIAYYGDPGGGAGGYSKATLTTPTSGEVLKVVVGQGGLVRDQTTQYGGGGPGGEGAQVGSSGGGYSGIFTGTTPLIISGGGGGTSPGSATNGTPGGGGGANQNGGQAGTAAVAGRGGTNSAGGAGATGNSSCPTTGSLSRNGSSLQGGASCNQANSEGGGGGGGGYYGGGGGTYQTAGGGPENGGGGGGSGYLDSTRGTLITAVAGGNGVLSNFSYPDITSVNYANNAGRGGKAYTNTVADNSGGNGLITIQWSSTTVSNPVANNTGNLVKYGYSFVGWNTAADGSGTQVPAGSTFPATASTTLYAEWVPSNTGLTPNFKTNTSTPIAVLKSTSYTINNEYTGTDNDLIVSQYADKIQIIATVPTGTLAITTTTNLTLPIGYQSALNTAASSISFVGNLADVNAALATLKYNVPATAVSTTVSITASYAGVYGNYRYNPATGSFYLRDATTVTRTTVLNRTTTSSNCGITFNGMCGYMAIPNNADESLFIFQKLGQGWIGLSKPSHPTLQYVANAPSGLPTTPFTFWSAGEGGVSAEPNIAIWNYGDGKWVDQGPQGLQGALYEFGGKSETPIFAALTRTIEIAPAITIKYLANGGTGTAPTALTSVAGSTIRAAANTGNLAKAGLTFAGWNTKADGTGVTYFPDKNFVGTETIDLYAMYLAACTPTRTTSGGFVVLTFTGAGNCLWTTPAGVTSIDLLTVGAGGGGAGNLGGGGGGGQVVYQTGLIPIGTAVVTVGAGGAGGVGQYNVTTNHGKTGVRSGLVSSTLNQVALGGSGGKGRLSASNLNPDGTPIDTGWTGGGAAYQDSAAQIIPDPGVGGNSFIGGAGSGNGGGGGGGAGGVGVGAGATSNAGSGGPGVSNSISGTATNYGGGGGTALYGTNSKWTGLGGIGGGANATATGVGTAGAANTGGGGSSGYTQGGGAGGTGIVILRYAYGTPSAPTITSVTGSANKLTVAFNAPASDGGAAIANYEYSLDGGSTWTAISPADATSPIEITKLANGTTALTNGTTYQVAIRANNGKTGLASNVVAGTTPLSPPTLSVVAGNARTTITVAAAVGESPTSFTVTALDNSGVALNPAKTCTVTSPATSCVITGLTNGTPYKFSAVANLGTQSSTATTTSTGVTPAAPIVTYNANNGTVGSSNAATLDIPFNAGTPVVHPLPVRAGYNFTGWFNSSNTFIGQNGSNYEPAATITLTAGWAGVTYSISYNGNGNTGGSVPATGSYVNGSGTAYSIVGNTGALVKTGYTFVQWVDGAGSAAPSSYSTGADLQLFAKWEAVQYTVSFDSAGGSVSPSNQNYTYGADGITLPSPGTRAGFTFIGWSRTSSGATVSSPFIATSATTLYARWTGSTYSVAFNSNGGSLSPANMSYTTGGATLTLPSAGTRSGFNFSGWYAAADGSGSEILNGYAPTVNVTLYAKWTAIQYNITYNRGTIAGVAVPSTGQLSTFPTNSTATLSTLINLDSTIDTSTVVSPTTYVFTGWKESGTNAVYKGGDAYRMPAADVTFTAQWVAVYTVSYILNGGTGAVPADVTRIDTYQETLTNVVPTRLGFNFSKWVDQKGLDVTTSFTVNADRYLLYAVWTPITYKVTYLANGGTGGPSGTTDGNYGASVTLDSTLPTRTSAFKFVGWKIGSTIYSVGGSYILIADVNAEAQWESTLSQIFYDINGGTGTAPSPSVATQDVLVTLPLVGTFSRAGYSLAGWTGGGVSTPAATFTNSTTNSVTLIAQWTLLAPSVPSAPTAVAGSGSATVTVNPTNTGGPADSYVVTASPGGATCTVFAPSTSCVIQGLENGESYTFTSTATNSAGSATASAASNSIKPAGKPSVVTGASATASNASAVVRFTAPASNGGAPIVSYTVNASTGQTCVITANPNFPDPLGCTVNGLTNGTAVTFAVQANNGAYISDSSTATIAITPATVPAAPTGVTATTNSPGKATITLTAPTDNGGSAVTEYVITSSPGGLTCTTTNPTTGCEITGLTNGTAYTFTAVAKNSVGNSASSTPSAAVTPVGKPSTPTNVVASAGNASASVSFTAPNTGGSPITSYQVEAYDENDVPISPALTCTLNVPFPTPLVCTFANTLTNGLKYAFKVSATNLIGTSDSSTATAVITPANLINPTADQILTPTGESIVGGVLTSSVQFGGFPTPTVTYVWERCTTSAATSCTTIVGATSDTYTTTSADIGSYIRYKATGSNSGGTAVGTSATTDKITDNPVLIAPTSGLAGITGTAFSLSATVSGGADPYTFAVNAGTLPAGLTLDATTGTISGTPTAAGSSAITLLVADAKGKEATAVFTIVIAAAVSNVVPTPTPTPEPQPEPVCDAACRAADAALAKAAADKAKADAAAKAAADKAAADAAAKVKADAAATSASSKAAADAAAAAAAAKAAVDKAAAAALAQAAADAAAKLAAAQAKAATEAQAVAAKAAADAAAALKKSTTSAAAKAAATKSANTAAALASAAVKAAADAATEAAKAKTTAANANKQVDIAINSLNSKTAASQASAQANAIAAAAKAAANEAAAAAAAKAAEAKASANEAQKAAADTAARIVTEQKEAAAAAAAAKEAADAAAKATAEKTAAAIAAKTATENLVKVLEEKATLAEQAAKTSDENVRAEIAKKIEEIEVKAEAAEKIAEQATAAAEEAIEEYEAAVEEATEAKEIAETQAAEAVAVKAESATKTAAATKAVAVATVAAKVAVAAKAAAAKVPSKAVITKKPAASTKKNSATATVTGLKPGQKVKVTVNVRPKP